MRERIKTPPAPEVVAYLFRPRSLTFLDRDFRLLMWINKAHALMLVRQGILSADTGRPLLRALSEMAQEGAEGLSLDPNLEDIYLNMEHALIQKVGTDVGGRLHTGRSRNDLYSTMTRMAVREALLSVLEAMFQVREALLEIAQEHLDTVMPGYTHLQPAQPTTFGHYLASVAMAMERDGERLLQVYPRLNLNPLGACAFAGTGFPIDRNMTARLLGFDGVVDSTLDAVASRDYVSELLAGLAIMGITFSRLAQDLYLWCSDEWGVLEVADDVAMTSSIMPQKKNPITLEHIKSKAGQMLGSLVASLAVQKNVNFMHCRDMSTEAVAPLWDALAQTEAVLHLARRTLTGLTVRKDLMAQRAVEDFCTATELADFLVREKGLPFRLAHAIVGNVVTYALEQGLRSDGISVDLIERASREVTDEPVGLSQEQVKRALDPLLNLESKQASGSPSASETRMLLRLAKEAVERQKGVAQDWRAGIDSARGELERLLANCPYV